MSDRFRIDSHKLKYHTDRIHQWLQTGDAYPIYMEVSPAGICNHRCTFCALDFMGYQKRFLDAELLKKRLAEMGQLGVRSIMYAGEGEPFLHREMVEIAVATKTAGIDVAFTSNGVPLKERIAEQVLPVTEWIKISINAGTQKTYSQIHQCPDDHFERVFNNLDRANRLRKQHGWSCALGMQLLLLPENAAEVTELAKRARDIGMDYLVVKPYSQHPGSETTAYKEVDYSQYLELADELKGYSNESFNVLFRSNAMEKSCATERCYDRCLAIPFWAYIDAGGNVWGCSVHLGEEQFNYGNIAEKSFGQIWSGEKRQKSLEWMQQNLDLDSCRINCRMDEVNNYLWDLTHPPEHVNFI
jgi:GTP 3',8-cyclase